MRDDLPAFSYVVEPLPPSGLGRRWRWQLYRGERLIAAGWRLGEGRALSALRTAAARATHELAGVIALRPERTSTDRPFVPGATVRLACGALGCVLAPRDVDELPAAATAA
jgi:hypothetical protein